MPRRFANEGDSEHMMACETVRQNRREQETPPMIVNDISHLFTGRMRLAETSGVMSQPSARLILRMLSGRDGIRQNDIAQATHLSTPTVSITLKRMEAEGLVHRVASAHDLRAVRVLLTDLGREYDKGLRVQLEELSDTMMEGFSEQEAGLLTDLLSRMRENLLRLEGDGRKTNDAKK